MYVLLTHANSMSQLTLISSMSISFNLPQNFHAFISILQALIYWLILKETNITESMLEMWKTDLKYDRLVAISLFLCYVRWSVW